VALVLGLSVLGKSRQRRPRKHHEKQRPTHHDASFRE
jgi:hypothetical protein